MDNTVQVQGHHALIKDTNSKGVINVDDLSYAQVQIRRAKKKNDRLLLKRVEALEATIKSLEIRLRQLE